MTLAIPEHVPDDLLAAALAYAGAGWYVGPTLAGSKNPGILLGKGWHAKTSREPDVIVSWFAGAGPRGLFLHMGRSGALAIDVDTPDNLHPDIVRAVAEFSPPFQSSRSNNPGCGHVLFAQPPGRRLGSGLGSLAAGWGEVRGLNGVIIATPSVHKDVAQGGLYSWQRTGVLPELPDYLAVHLTDAPDAADAATDAEIAAFVAAHQESSRPGVVDVHRQSFRSKVSAGESRHDSMRSLWPVHCESRRPVTSLPRGSSLCSKRRSSKRSHWRRSASRATRAPARWRPTNGGGSWRGRSVRLTLPIPTRPALEPNAKCPPARPHPRRRPGHCAADICIGNRTCRRATESPAGRLVLTSFDDVEMEAVDWLWAGRIPLGSLTLLAGREGLGKSMIAYQFAADLSRGALPGEFAGKAAKTIIVATEDSIKKTVKPRLIAAGADTAMISYVTVKNPTDGAVSLPADLDEFGRLAQGSALIILDPLMSRLHHTLDSHKDGGVRQALEPLVAMADRIGAAIVGLIHVSKSSSPDLLTTVMGSRAFAAVARAVLAVVVDPDNDGQRVLYQAKSNLGRLDFAGRTFEINDVIVGRVGNKDIHTGQLKWLGDSTRSP